MMNRIIELSARNRVAVFLFIAAAVVAGWYSIESVPLDAIPDLSDTQVIAESQLSAASGAAGVKHDQPNH
jgi:copper/silver efflux system protein